MSSDESTSTTTTTTSTISNRNNNTGQESKKHKLEKWEINLVGNLLLDMYHRSIITHQNGWCIDKSKLSNEYSQKVSTELRNRLRDVHGSNDIGTFLQRSGFLNKTKQGSSFYQIRIKSLFEFRNEKLRKLDNLKINSDESANDDESDELLLNLMKNNSIFSEEDISIIDENQRKLPLEYQGIQIQRRKENFCPTNMSCYICQEDFSTMEAFEEHIQIHSDETDYEFLNTMSKLFVNNSTFTISYRLCKNSHNFCFDLESNQENVIIEKIIIVQTRSFFYVNNMRVPYKYHKNETNHFFVDSHLFTIHVEQPIVIIFHLEDNNESRMVEQHHFMRSEEFPKVNFSIKPYRLPDNKIFKPKIKLADYFPPKEIRDALKDDFYYESLMKTSNEFRDYIRNGKNLQPQTIGESLNILLQIEDMDTLQQYLNLQQRDIKLRSYGDEYSFKLKPNQRIFLENVLTVYDEVVLTTRKDIFTSPKEIMQLIFKNKTDINRMSHTFVGLIQAVNTGRISFKCDKKLDIHHSYTVLCRPSRLNLRYQYRSLQLLLSSDMHFLKKFLFPTKTIPMPTPSSISINPYNKMLNPEQLEAVCNISEGICKNSTYILFGPPGTGKTTTLVECILQVLKQPQTKIVVTASSNSACDEIALRLCKYLRNLDITRALVRIYSRSSEVRVETIDDNLLDHSNMYNGQFYPDIDILHQYRIVVCTLCVVAKLALGKFGRAHNGVALYSHLFIDEVAASKETETLMAITTIVAPTSYLIISGDHKQLGPVLQSKRAQELGLDVSMMDRLLERDCYRVNVDSGDYDRTIQTRLVRNYRSHPAIVNLYSGLYYNHSLCALAKLDDVSLCELWHKSRNKKYPISFHATYEPSQSDKQSHSLYNRKELHVVMEYVKDFMYFGINGKPVKESDIGIISPYKKQYQRIQEELNMRKWFGIKTGSVETFQGKEKNIIIVSFVRSGTETLGFLDNPRRLNVTISRAKSLLILIGNPETLSLSSEFDYIIKECQRNNTFVGSLNPPREDQTKQLTENVGNYKDKLSDVNKNMPDLKLGRGGKQVPMNSNTRKNDTSNIQKAAGGNNEITNIKNKGQSTEISQKNRRRDRNNAKNNLSHHNDGNTDGISYSKNNAQKAYEKQRSQKSGGISKKNSKTEQKSSTDNNKRFDKSIIDSIFDDLPDVPSTSTKSRISYTKDQLLQLRQQQQHYYRLQQNQHNINSPPTTAHSCFNTLQQQHQSKNSLAFSQPQNYSFCTNTNGIASTAYLYSGYQILKDKSAIMKTNTAISSNSSASSSNTHRPSTPITSTNSHAKANVIPSVNAASSVHRPSTPTTSTNLHTNANVIPSVNAASSVHRPSTPTTSTNLHTNANLIPGVNAALSVHRQSTPTTSTNLHTNANVIRRVNGALSVHRPSIPTTSTNLHTNANVIPSVNAASSVHRPSTPTTSTNSHARANVIPNMNASSNYINHNFNRASNSRPTSRTEKTCSIS